MQAPKILIPVVAAVVALTVVGCAWLLLSDRTKDNEPPVPETAASPARPGNQQEPASDQQRRSPVAADQNRDGHRLGPETSRFVLTEAVDLGCPACARYYKILIPIIADYSDRIIFEFRHYPLVENHPNAMIAHEAAEAAGRQNQFWAMIEKIFADQMVWGQQTAVASQATMEQFAQDLGLNLDRFVADMKSPQTVAAIAADRAWVESRGAGQATPAFFVNGEFIANATVPPDEPSLRQLLDDLLASIETS